ncbi:MAG TPA: histidine phosphatase family protein [Caulobacteraceae bacterium]|jgi:phosphohistidine phosphatase
MRRLILFRHAKTETRTPDGDDIGRRLVDRGRSDAALMGRVLADAGFTPDLALVSPAARAKETWELAKAAFPQAKVRICKDIYDATPEEIAAEIDEEAGSDDTVMVVGHNPGLQELAVNLVAENNGRAEDIDRLSAAFPTAAVAVFTVDDHGRSELEALFRASDYRAGGALNR